VQASFPLPQGTILEQEPEEVAAGVFVGAVVRLFILTGTFVGLSWPVRQHVSLLSQAESACLGLSGQFDACMQAPWAVPLESRPQPFRLSAKEYEG